VLKSSIINIEIDKNLSLLKKIDAYKEDTCIETMQKTKELYETLIERKKQECIAELTMFMNQIIVGLFSAKEILKDVSISNNSGY